jgi:hypothetical protein
VKPHTLEMTMDSRETEGLLLARCAAAAGAASPVALNQREANVFRVAGLVVRNRFPLEAAHLLYASDQYFSVHPEERLSPEEVVRKGWVFSFPRLRDMLTLRLRHG